MQNPEHELRELIRETRDLLREFHRHPRPAVSGRFAGFYHLDPAGNIVMAVQQLTLNTPSTCLLTFVDGTGSVVTGPIGIVTASDPSVTVGLSADGQACNATMTATVALPVTLTWHDPAGNVPDFTTLVTDQAVGATGATGSFGTFATGTTA